MMNLTITKIANFLGHKNALYRLHRITDQRFYSAGADGMLVEWNINDPDNGLMLANANEPIYCITQRGNLLYLGLKKGELLVLDIEAKKELKRLIVADNPIFSLVQWNDIIVIGSEAGVIYLLNKDFKITQKLKVSIKAIRSLHVVKEQLFIGCSDGKLYQCSINLDDLREVYNHGDTIFHIAHQKNQLVTACKDARLRIFDLTSLAINDTIEAHWYHIKHIDFNPKHALMLSTSMDKTIRIWDTQDWQLLKVIDKAKNDGHTSSVNCGLWLDEKTVISCSDDRSIMAFHIEIKNT